MSASPTPDTPRPPRAARRPHVHSEHGEAREDPYHWLRFREDPAVMAYLRAENVYTEAIMEPTRVLQEQLYQELLGRIEEDYESASHRDGDYAYFFRYQAGKEFRIYCRRALSEGAGEEIYLDGNALADGQEYLDIGYIAISFDGRLMAVAYDTSGDERYTLRFKDLIKGEWLPDAMPEVSGGNGEWSADGRYFFYVVEEPENQRPHRIMRHRLGSPASEDACVYEDPDPLYYVDIDASQDRLFLFASSESKTTSEVSSLRSDDPEGRFEIVQPRRKDIRYYADHHEGRFLLRTNEEARNFKLVAVPVDIPLSEDDEVLAHDPGVDFMDFLPLADYLVLFIRIAGLDQVVVRRWETGESYTVEFPEEVHALTESVNAEYQTGVLNLIFDSPITPTTTLQVELASGERHVLKQARVPRGHRPEAYTAYRERVIAPDGVEVPLTIYHRRDAALDGSAPAYLYAYGSYGDTSDPHFDPAVLSYLERGFVCAIAHVRGGGLLGEPWYEAGKLLQKKNSFTDFIACAEHLVRQRLTAPDRLAILGGSAGGLLVGAVLNARPDLFGAAVAEVPFVDVVSTMLDESIPLTTFEWEEWGDPREKPFFDYMLSYSPYDNVRAQVYPPLLVTAGLNDPRVQYWEPAKWIARLRAEAEGGPFLLKTNLEAGHDGATARYAACRESAFEQAFILRQLGLA